ncbi:MAG: hypothetical protein ACNYPD_06145 [Candidatus Halichondribacter symbioticus]
MRDNNLGRNTRNAKLGDVRGLIGEEGMVGVFIGASLGGFVVDNPNFVADLAPSVSSTADWARSFILPLPATIATSNPGTNVVGDFLNLATSATTIVAGDLKTEASGSTASTSAILPRAGSDNTDGVVYISGFKGDDNQAFVGLLPTTDLGATFLTSDTKAEWAGSYYDSTDSETTENAITFDIDFSTRAIGVKTGSIIAASPPTFDLVFSYAGVISGTVSKGGKVAIARGLIGAEGLVGAFIDTKTTAGLVFHGGFVAAPPVPDPCVRTRNCMANHADWRKSFGTSPPPATIDALTTEPTAVFGGFLNLATTTIAPGYLDTRPASERPLFGGTAMPPPSASLPRDGDNMDGFVYISGFGDNLGIDNNGIGNNQAFVGLLPTTNLGALLSEQPSIAEWLGSYYDSTLDTAANAIIFDIDFSNRSIDVKAGSITANDPPAFDLDFNHAGVITGTVNKGGTAAIARGLIGIEGLVGAFVDTSATAGSVFHGGFVATAPTCLADDTCVKHAIWLEDFGASPPPTTIATSATEAKVFGGFLNLADGATTIDAATFDSSGFATVLTARPASETGFNAPVPTASALPLTRDGDAMDGVVYIGGYNFNNHQAFVGLLSTTNLGTPFPISDTMATWRGKYYSSANSAVASSPVDFLIDFSDEQKIDGRDVSTNALIFELRFTDAGVISGTARDSTNTATASGLIGRQGLVGVFVDDTPEQIGQIPVLYGGFVADNPNP